MKPVIIVLICVLTPLALLSSGSLSGADNAPAPKLKITQTPIVKLDCPYGLIFSPDSRRVAGFLSGKGGKYVASVDGVVGKEYEDTGAPGYYSMLFSPDSKRYLYLGRRANKWLVVVDNVEGKECDAISGSPIFSPDSRHVAYIASRKDKWFVVLDGVEGKEYNGAFSLTFSPDSSRLAFVAYGDHGVIVVDNGGESKEYGSVETLAFSPDSKRLAFIAEPLRPQRPGDNGVDELLPFFLVVVDGVDSKEYMGINKSAPVFSPDSKHVAYAAPVDKWTRWTIVLDGVEGNKYDKIDTDSLVFSPNSNRLAYTATRDQKKLIVLDGGDGEAFDSVTTPLFSPDSNRLAYVASNKGKSLVVTDGTGRGPLKEKEYDGIDDITFSPDSSRLAYTAKHGENVLAVIDGVESKEYPQIVKTDNGHAPCFIFSTDGKHLAYAVSNKDFEVATWFLVFDGVETKHYQCHPSYVSGTYIAFNPDSSHCVYTIRLNNVARIVVDGAETAVNANLIDRIIFDSPAKFHGIAVAMHDYNVMDFALLEIEITR